MKQQIQDIIVGDNFSLYIARESLKKRKSIDLNSDQKWTQNHIRKLRTRVPVDRAADRLLTAVDRRSTAGQIRREPTLCWTLTSQSVNRAVDRLDLLLLLPLGSRMSGRSQLPCASFVHGRSIGPLSSAAFCLLPYSVELRSLRYFLQ